MRLRLKFFIWIVLLVSLLVSIVIFVDARSLSGLILIQKNTNEYEVHLDGEEFVLLYVPRENIEPLFGKALNEFGNEYALVRNDLPPRVQKFVARHEIYHLHDFRNNLHKSTLSQEIHANLAALPYEPLGFLQTMFLTLTNPQRLTHYFNKF